MRNIRLILAYDGTRYRGWQRLAGATTPSRASWSRPSAACWQSRCRYTAAGAPMPGFMHWDKWPISTARAPCPAPRYWPGLGQYLPEDIGVLSCQEVHPRFHARLNALSKTYLYRVWNSTEPCVFQRRYVYRMPEALDTAAMEQAAAHLLANMTFGPSPPASPERNPPCGQFTGWRSSERGRKCVSWFRGTDSCTTWCGLWWARYWRPAWAANRISPKFSPPAGGKLPATPSRLRVYFCRR